MFVGYPFASMSDIRMQAGMTREFAASRHTPVTLALAHQVGPIIRTCATGGNVLHASVCILGGMATPLIPHDSVCFDGSSACQSHFLFWKSACRGRLSWLRDACVFRLITLSLKLSFQLPSASSASTSPPLPSQMMSSANCNGREERMTCMPA